MPAPDEKASPIIPVTSEEENITLDRVLRSDPRTLTDQDLDILILKLRKDRARFIEAGDKKPRKGDPNGEENAANAPESEPPAEE